MVMVLQGYRCYDICSSIVLVVVNHLSSFEIETHTQSAKCFRTKSNKMSLTRREEGEGERRREGWVRGPAREQTPSWH